MWTVVAVVATLAGCVPQAAPAPAELRTTPPPWTAPRDAVSYIAAAGLGQVPLDTTDNQRVLTLTISIDQQPVPLAPYIGIDRVRALQAPVHTHDASGTVWLEGAGSDRVTLGQFFTLWGVRFADGCLGAACGDIDVTADGAPVADPSSLRLAGVSGTVHVGVESR